MLNGMIYPDRTGEMPKDWRLVYGTNEKLDTKNIEFTIEGDDDTIQAISLRLTGDYSLWKQITQDKLFMYSDEREGPVFGGGFDVTKTLFFTIHLKSDALTLLSIMSFSLDDVTNNLCSENFQFNCTSKYILDSVTQKRGPLEMGLKMKDVVSDTK